ncbi:hypothetical protein PVK06_004728 [Gossypium arboreum]|uniref:Uncharacterized protein n=1 Tax=Gossypium arboreum TaxID=29729 RepID=A0ABR0QU13_GOSAR|nr:hypothetical protein PVK06_004728 [Gossypium arboreum]
MKSSPFKDILNCLSSKINSWSKRLISYGGRGVFVKSILQALPTYALSIFLAPKGNGKSVDIHKDKWGFQGLSGDAFICNREQVNEKKVDELWVPDSKCWDRNRVNDTYEETLRDQICNIPIFSHYPNDVLIWFHSHHGTYTTKSAYSWPILKKMGMGSHRLLWKMI